MSSAQTEMAPSRQAWILGLALAGFAFVYNLMLLAIAGGSLAFQRFFYSELGTAILWLPMGATMVALCVLFSRPEERKYLFPVHAEQMGFFLSVGVGTGALFAISFMSMLFELAGLPFRILHHFGVSTFRYTFGSLIEEIFFRGLIFSRFRQRYSLNATIAATTFLFVLYHFRGLSQPLVGLVATGLMGVLFCGLREASKSLLPPMACHVTYNLFTGTS